MIICPDSLLEDENGSYVWSPEQARVCWDQALKQLEEIKNQADVIVLLVGVPAAGKSTWLAAQTLEPRTIYFDATFTRQAGRAEVLDRVPNLTKVAVVFKTPFGVCLQRNHERPKDRRVPWETMNRMYEQLRREPPQPNEGFSSIVVLP